MNDLLVVIPVHNYFSRAIRSCWWLRDEALVACGIKGAKILVYDDNSDEAYWPIFERVQEVFGVEVVDVPVAQSGGLRWALDQAGVMAREQSFDTVLCIESDAVPTVQTFATMWRLWNEPLLAGIERKAVVSVSPVYGANQHVVYPTNSHWFQEGHGNCYKVVESPVGRVSYANAVPFLFSLWSPYALSRIEASFPKLMHLDTALGEKLTREGFVHLRLLDHMVGHEGGGARSRKANRDSIKSDLAQCWEFLR